MARIATNLVKIAFHLPRTLHSTWDEVDMPNWTKCVVASLLVAGCATGDEDSGPRRNNKNIPVVSGGAPGAAGPAAPGGVAGACTEAVRPTSQLPRLTRVQYDNTVQDLLGVGGHPSAMLPPDSAGSVDKRAWDGYKAAAAAVAAQVIADPSARAKAIPCAPAGDGSACARQLIDGLGRRAFRRPMTPEDTARFDVLYARRAELTATGSFNDAAQLIIQAFLLSPSFLMRAEIAEAPAGQYFALSGYEIASRLSYMIWGTMPDEPLFAAAASGMLVTDKGILEHARRMLTDPRARATVRAFHETYLHMGDGTRWTNMQRDPALYPAFKPALIPLLSEETTRFVDYVVNDRRGTLSDLLTTPVAFVNAALAPLYGLNAASFGQQLTKVDLDPATRAGLLTRAGFLTAYALYNRPSPILRGAFIQKEVLCTPIGSPPPNAESTPLPTAGLATNRERTDAQTSAPACAGCHHTFINPTGFAMEAYDAIGAIQTAERDTRAPINSASNVQIGSMTMPVTGPVSLMKAIAAAPETRQCYAKKWLEFAFAQPVTPQQSCTVSTLAERLGQSGYAIVDLMADLTQLQSFRYRALEVGP